MVVPVLSASPAAIDVALQVHAGGILLLGPAPPAAQLRIDLAPAAAGPVGLLVMADEEGGGVQRLVPDVTSLPWPRQMAATMSPGAVQAATADLARQMKALGVNTDLAPVLDLDGGPYLSATDADGPRSFSTSAATAATYGVAFAEGLQSGGVLAVVKHFPGIGGAQGNTDYGPAATAPIAALQAAGLIPFERAVAAGVGAVMVSNASVPGVTQQPASLSAAVITGILRGQLHFGGLVLTDSLSAGAVSAAGYGVPQASVAAVEAGADMVLFGSTLTPADTALLAPGPLKAQSEAIVTALVTAVGDGSLSVTRLDDAVGHVLAAKGVRLCP